MLQYRGKTIPRFILTGKTDVTILRHNPKGGYVNGKWVNGPEEEIIIQANVQPYQFKNIMMLPESDRTKEWIAVYTTDLLRTADEGESGWEADTVLWNGQRYKVMRCNVWEMGPLDHREILAAREPISAKG